MRQLLVTRNANASPDKNMRNGTLIQLNLNLHKAVDAAETKHILLEILNLNDVVSKDYDNLSVYFVVVYRTFDEFLIRF